MEGFYIASMFTFLSLVLGLNFYFVFFFVFKNYDDLRKWAQESEKLDKYKRITKRVLSGFVITLLIVAYIAFASGYS